MEEIIVYDTEINNIKKLENLKKLKIALMNLTHYKIIREPILSLDNIKKFQITKMKFIYLLMLFLMTKLLVMLYFWLLQSC